MVERQTPHIECQINRNTVMLLECEPIDAFRIEWCRSSSSCHDNLYIWLRSVRCARDCESGELSLRVLKIPKIKTKSTFAISASESGTLLIIKLFSGAFFAIWTYLTFGNCAVVVPIFHSIFSISDDILPLTISLLWCISLVESLLYVRF